MDDSMHDQQLEKASSKLRLVWTIERAKGSHFCGHIDLSAYPWKMENDVDDQ
jgi:hypothetical protein